MKQERTRAERCCQKMQWPSGFPVMNTPPREALRAMPPRPPDKTSISCSLFNLREVGPVSMRRFPIFGEGKDSYRNNLINIKARQRNPFCSIIHRRCSKYVQRKGLNENSRPVRDTKLPPQSRNSVFFLSLTHVAPPLLFPSR